MTGSTRPQNGRGASTWWLGFAAAVGLCLLLQTPATRAAESTAPAAGTETPVYSPKGADTCLKCHDDSRTMSIFQTPHAVSADPRTPFAHLQCESCHGPSGDHARHRREGEPRPPPPFLGPHSTAAVADNNAVCLSCHQNNHHVSWDGSAHQRENVACSNCHTIHAEQDPVRTAGEQPQVCYKCHQQQRAEFLRPFAHPVRDGQLQCSDCHSPHDSKGPDLLVRATINDTCYSCHAEKRGPYLWEHPPVSEDCTLCHSPHGSVNPSLLTSRPPLLCQQCHAPSGHPSLAFSAAGLPNDQPSGFLLAGSCLNCHAQVHGSNHPSGAALNR